MRFARGLTALVSILTASSLLPPALAAPLLAAPRVAAYDGYTRLVLDLPSGVTYRLEPLGAALRVTLAGVVGTPATVSVKKPELSGYTVANASGSAVLNIVSPQGVSQQSGFKASLLEAATGKTGYRLVLDFSGAFADTTKLLNPAPLRLGFAPAQPLTVLLDPGHGGTDAGALGNGLHEDALNLGMAMRVKAWLERVPGVRVELTRTSNMVFSNDKRTDLNARAQMSRGKTLFVSLHANAVPRASWNSQFGVETYYFSPSPTRPLYVPPLGPQASAAPASTLSTASSTASSTISSTAEPSTPEVFTPSEKPVLGSEPATLISAPASNFASAPTLEDLAATSLEPAMVGDGAPTNPATSIPVEKPLEDPGSTAPLEPAAVVMPASPVPVAPVIAPSSVTAPLTTPAQIGISLTLPGLERVSASKMLASSVQSRLIYATHANNRGVRSADFYVIKNAECPAILVEIGFITHPIEAQMLKNANYLERVSYGVASGVTAYLNDIAAP